MKSKRFLMAVGMVLVLLALDPMIARLQRAEMGQAMRYVAPHAAAWLGLFSGGSGRFSEESREERQETGETGAGAGIPRAVVAPANDSEGGAVTTSADFPLAVVASAATAQIESLANSLSLSTRAKETRVIPSLTTAAQTALAATQSSTTPAFADPQMPVVTPESTLLDFSGPSWPVGLTLAGDLPVRETAKPTGSTPSTSQTPNVLGPFGRSGTTSSPTASSPTGSPTTIPGPTTPNASQAPNQTPAPTTTPIMTPVMKPTIAPSMSPSATGNSISAATATQRPPVAATATWTAEPGTVQPPRSATATWTPAAAIFGTGTATEPAKPMETAKTATALPGRSTATAAATAPGTLPQPSPTWTPTVSLATVGEVDFGWAGGAVSSPTGEMQASTVEAATRVQIDLFSSKPYVMRPDKKAIQIWASSTDAEVKLVFDRELAVLRVRVADLDERNGDYLFGLAPAPIAVEGNGLSWANGEVRPLGQNRTGELVYEQVSEVRLRLHPDVGRIDVAYLIFEVREP